MLRKIPPLKTTFFIPVASIALETKSIRISSIRFWAAHAIRFLWYSLFKSKSLVSYTEVIVLSCKNIEVNVTPPFDFTSIPLKSGNTLDIFP